MSKMNLGITAIALSGIVLMSGLSTRTAQAQSDEAAVVYHACPSAYGELSLGGYDFEYCFDSTTTPSGNSNAQFHGFLVDTTTAPRKTAKLSGFGCSAGGEITYDTELSVTPSGEIHGSCKLHQ